METLSPLRTRRRSPSLRGLSSIAPRRRSLEEALLRKLMALLVLLSARSVPSVKRHRWSTTQCSFEAPTKARLCSMSVRAAATSSASIRSDTCLCGYFPLASAHWVYSYCQWHRRELAYVAAFCILVAVHRQWQLKTAMQTTLLVDNLLSRVARESPETKTTATLIKATA